MPAGAGRMLMGKAAAAGGGTDVGGGFTLEDSYQENQTSNATDITIVIGTDINVNDDELMFAWHWNFLDATELTWPSGWTAGYFTPAAGGNTISLATGYKIASSESGTLTFDAVPTTNSDHTIHMVTISGVDTTTPIDIAETTGGRFTNTPDPTTASLTTVTDGALMLAAATIRNTTATFNADPSQGTDMGTPTPTGLNSLFGVTYYIVASLGASGTTQFFTTASGGTESAGFQVGIRPA